MLRSIEYWADSGVEVHFLDGSTEPLVESSQASLAVNIHYHYSPVSLYERFRQAIDMINTKYVALLSDDEFFLKSGLKRCIMTMEQEPDLVSCNGRALGFSKEKGRATGSQAYPGLAGYAVLQNDPFERMNYHMANYIPSTIYSVVRADAWKRAMKLVVSREYNAYALMELQFALVLHYFGKSKVIPELVWMRSREVRPIRGTSPSLNEKNLLTHWWSNQVFQKERELFLSDMAKVLSTNEAQQNFVGRLSIAFEHYIVRQKNKKQGFAEQYIAPFVPPSIKKATWPAREMLKRLLGRGSKPISLMKAGRVLRDSGVKVDDDDFDKVIQLVERGA